MARIVETDNYGGDYPDEKFVNIPPLPKTACKRIADIINQHMPMDGSRFWKTVEDDYELQPGFKP